MTATHESPAGYRPRLRFRWLLAWACVLAVRLQAVEIAEARTLLRTGETTKVIALATQALKDGDRDEEWPLLLGRGLLTVGRYPEAAAAMTNAVAKNSRSIRLRWLAREAAFANGDTNRAEELLDDIKQAVGSRNANLRDAASMVVFARAALLLGADPKSVLEKILEPARKLDPDLRDTYLARGEIALEKHDFDLAAKAFDEGLKKHPDDPDLLCGLARAHAEGDRQVLNESLDAALRINPHHVPSLLVLVDHLIDGEDYEAAIKSLEEIHKVNPWQPEAWAYRAVLAHLKNDTAAESAARDSALKFWKSNPGVDHLIGLKLAQKYRFTEGAAHQRQALAFDADYLPAKAQLANDLLRLGEEAEGWRLAQEVNTADGYDVAAYNLVTLHDTMTKYVTLTNAHFVLRISRHEAEVYAPRVLELLDRARTTLCTKYGMELKFPTIVEVFAEQKDFGVRTFGMPDNPGYLGVCFGRVVTANGPAANKGGDVNWEAVLWHEFCHVVTLQMTANKMPRWLSEGISVYEELQANPAWGQRMTPRYRAMILGGELTPVAKLSGAFMAPKTPFHLQFAYYESSLVVDFFIRRFGLENLKAILRDLHDGADLNVAIAKHTAPLATIEKEFAAFATDKAKQLAPGLDWEQPGSLADVVTTNKTIAQLLPGGPKRNRSATPSLSDAELAKWASSRPTNFYALNETARRLAAEKKWAEAKVPLVRLIELFPGQTGADSPYPLLAAAHRALGETNEERQVLQQFTTRDAGATDAYLRQMELSTAVKDWSEVTRNAQRFLAVNPLVAPPYRYLAQAAETTGDVTTAVAAYATLLKLDPPNPAVVHFQLARLLKTSDAIAARRHTLQALEEAPRHREALRLLLELQTNSAPVQPRTVPTDGIK